MLEETEIYLPFEIKIDGEIVENSRNLATEFIFPNIVVWENGTLSNLFLMNTPEFNHQLQFSPYGSLEGNQYIINITNMNDQKIISRDIETGVLMWWHLEIWNTVVSYEFLSMELVEDKEGSILDYIPLTIGVTIIALVISFFFLRWRKTAGNLFDYTKIE